MKHHSNSPNCPLSCSLLGFPAYVIQPIDIVEVRCSSYFETGEARHFAAARKLEPVFDEYGLNKFLTNIQTD